MVFNKPWVPHAQITLSIQSALAFPFANDGYMAPLTAAEKVELEELKAWQADVPDHLKYTPSPNMVAILKGFRDNEGRTSPAHPQCFEEPAERRQRLPAERQPVVEVKGAALLGDPDVVEAQQDEADEGFEMNTINPVTSDGGTPADSTYKRAK
jgi:hypothetical protein